jgi:hypothetical protein
MTPGGSGIKVGTARMAIRFSHLEQFRDVFGGRDDYLLEGRDEESFLGVLTDFDNKVGMLLGRE